MSNHVFSIFSTTSNSIDSNAVSLKKRSNSSNTFQPIKPAEVNRSRIKSTSGLNVRKPLADRAINTDSKIEKKNIEIVKPIIQQSLIPENKSKDQTFFQEIDDDYEDIWPKAKRFTKDDIVDILNCLISPKPNSEIRSYSSDINLNQLYKLPDLQPDDENMFDNYLYPSLPDLSSEDETY